jgi:hypothetical protein
MRSQRPRVEPLPLPGRRCCRGLAVAACAAGVAVGVLVLALPGPLGGFMLPPDAIGYLGTAHSWLNGAGFVDPVLYSHYLPGASAPVPAFAVRPPLPSLLLALPLAAGASVTATSVTHVAWAALVAAGALLVGLRSMSLPAATAFALLVGWCPGWIFVAQRPISEVTAVGVLLLALLAVRRAADSLRGALLFALLVLVGWLARPNLLVLLPAVVVAVACERGWRVALRSKPLWASLLACVLLQLAVVQAVTAATGRAPYAHYGVMAEIIDVDDIFLAQKHYVGWLAFVRENHAAILASLAANLAQAWERLFASPFYLRLGWLLVPALAVALWPRRQVGLELRFAAVAALAFTAVALGVYGGFAPQRYLLLGVVCGCFVWAGLADRGARALAERAGAAGPQGRLARATRWLPALLALGLFAAQSGPSLAEARAGWQRVRSGAPARPPNGPILTPLCASIDPDALVASQNPWWLYFWCGNAGLRIPEDLGPELLERYLAERHPGYLVVVDDQPRWDHLDASPQLRRVELEHRWAVYEVLDAGPASRPWHAPPPLPHRTGPGRRSGGLARDAPDRG